jgi:hypothetical protein
MKEQLPSEERSITLQDENGFETTFSIEDDGGMCMDDYELCILRIAKDELPKLRAWLNKVLS